MANPSEQAEHWQAIITERYPLVLYVFDWAAARGISVFLVGGTVRDLLMDADTHDLDFAVDGDGLEIARCLADDLHGAYVPLDRERRTGRVLLTSWPHTRPSDPPHRYFLDMASMRGSDLVSDLRDRDFTINAIAAGRDGASWHLYDPLGGIEDIRKRVLRTPSPLSFTSDPVRTLRAIRMHIQFQCSLEPETRQRLVSAAPLLSNVSAERVRDEWFNILMRPRAATALAELREMGLLQIIAAPMDRLQRIQCDRGSGDALAHSISVVAALEQWWAALRLLPSSFPLPAPDAFSTVSSALRQRYEGTICDERTMLGLLKCAGFLHNVGKLPGSVLANDQRIHPRQVAAEAAEKLGRQWRLSNVENAFLRTVVAACTQPDRLAQEPILSRRATHRYFRENGEYGIDAAIVSMAHYAARNKPDPADTAWQRQVATVVQLLVAFFHQHDTVIAPPPLLNGTDLLTLFDLSPGPLIGTLLSSLYEAQAADEFHTREEAIAAAASLLRSMPLVPPVVPAKHDTET